HPPRTLYISVHKRHTPSATSTLAPYTTLIPSSFSISSLSVGSHAITATYADDGNFNPSTSALLSQVVNKANTTTSLASSVNPSADGQRASLKSSVLGTSVVAYWSSTVNFFVDN